MENRASIEVQRTGSRSLKRGDWIAVRLGSGLLGGARVGSRS